VLARHYLVMSQTESSGQDSEACTGQGEEEEKEKTKKDRKIHRGGWKGRDAILTKNEK